MTNKYPAKAGLKFDLSIHLHPYFVYASNECKVNRADWPEPLLLAVAISTKILCTGLYISLNAIACTKKVI